MNQKVLEDAIRGKSIVEFSYAGHRRVVEPHVLGVSGGNVKVLCFQIGGSSSSGGIPEWRRFDLGQISGILITDKYFAGRRPFPSGRHSSWDHEILVVAP